MCLLKEFLMSDAELQGLESHEEDLLGLAGWMYADLFLALMVIFLATISFIPSLVHNPVLKPQAQTSVQANANHFKALSITLNNPDVATIEKLIYNFQLSEGLNQGDPVVYAQIIGGYNSAYEAPEAGAMRAVVLSTKLQTAKSGMFRGMAANIDSSSKIHNDEIALVLTFGPKQ
jgi:hypothetical protein